MNSNCTGIEHSFAGQLVDQCSAACRAWERGPHHAGPFGMSETRVSHHRADTRRYDQQGGKVLETARGTNW